MSDSIDDIPWTKLKENECPVNPNDKVQVKYAYSTGSIDFAHRYRWDKKVIKYYRIIKKSVV